MQTRQLYWYETREKKPFGGKGSNDDLGHVIEPALAEKYKPPIQTDQIKINHARNMSALQNLT